MRACGQCTEPCYGREDIKIKSERQPWRGFVNSVCRYSRLTGQRGAKPNPPTTPHFTEKKFLRKKIREDENHAAFSPILRLTGRVLEDAVIAVIVIQIATANAAKGF